MASRRLPWPALASALALVASGCLAPPAGGPGPQTLGAIEIHVVTVNLTVVSSNSSGAALNVDPIHLPHCSFAYLMDNGSTLRVFGAMPDTAATSVLLVRYVQPTSFSGGGDDTLVFFLRAREAAAVPSALNGSQEAYRYDPDHVVPFAPAGGGVAGADEFSLDYRVRGNLTLYPDFYPSVEGTFDVREEHTVASRNIATLEWGGGGACA